MSERTKFILKVVLFIGVSVLIALALYFVFFRAVVPEEVPTGEVPEGGALPTAGVGAPGTTPGGVVPPGGEVPTKLPPSQVAKGGETFTTLLTNTSIQSPTATANGTMAYYDPADGKFYTIDENGNVVAMSQVSFPKADNVTFDAGATAAVIEFPDGSNVIYDFETAKQVTLPNHWEDFSFSGNGDQIAAKSIGTDESNRALVITNTDGTQTKVLAALGANDDKVTVNVSPSDNVLGFSDTGGSTSGSFGRHEMYLIGPDGSASGMLIVDGTSFKNIWAPDGKNLLYSVADPNNLYKAVLWYADSQGDRKGVARRKMGISTTVDKCTFTTNTTAYCAVPREMPPGGGSDSSAITSSDDLYKLNITTGNATLVATPAADTKMFSPSVSSDGANFFYTDASGRLNVIRLK